MGGEKSSLREGPIPLSFRGFYMNNFVGLMASDVARRLGVA